MAQVRNRNARVRGRVDDETARRGLHATTVDLEFDHLIIVEAGVGTPIDTDQIPVVARPRTKGGGSAAARNTSESGATPSNGEKAAPAVMTSVSPMPWLAASTTASNAERAPAPRAVIAPVARLRG